MVKKVLIVDDEEDILTSVRMLIESMGYEAKTINDGKKALELLKKETFDLILLDILMPGMSGKEVLEKIRQDPKLKNQKVAFMTVVRPGKIGEETINKLAPAAYFNKPLDLPSFKEKLKSLLG